MTEGPDTGDQPRRRSTATSNLGVGKREGHDATAFYARFVPPALSDDDKKVAVGELGVAFDLVATDTAGRRWLVVVAGGAVDELRSLHPA